MSGRESLPSAIIGHVHNDANEKLEGLVNVGVNILTTIVGTNEVTATYPQGIEKVKPLGEEVQIAIPPYWVSCPLMCAGNKNWHGPKNNFQVVSKPEYYGRENMRPVLLLGVQPSSFTSSDEGKLTDLTASIAWWIPGKPKLLFYDPQRTTTIVSSTQRHAITAQTLGLDVQEKKEIDTSSLEAYALINGTVNWINQQLPEDYDTSAHHGLLFQAFREAISFDLHQRKIWKQAEMNGYLGHLIASGRHYTLSAALQTLFVVPDSQKAQFLNGIFKIEEEIKNREINNWPTWCEGVVRNLSGVSATFGFGWSPIGSFINKVMNFSIIKPERHKEVLAETMGVDIDDVPSDVGVSESIVRFLVSDTRMLGAMVKSMDRWYELSVRITEASAGAIEEGMLAALIIQEAYKKGWKVLRKTIEDEESSITREIGRVGRDLANKVIGDIALDAEVSLGMAIGRDIHNELNKPPFANGEQSVRPLLSGAVGQNNSLLSRRKLKPRR